MSAYDYKVLSSNGDLVDLSHYKGHVTLFVNVSCFDDKAKKCYELLATVYQKYKDEDLAVLLFPCSQFGSKETSPEKEIQFLQSSNLSDAGIIFKELEVNGTNTHPLYKFLKNAKPGTAGGFIKCNFSLFIVDRQGAVVERLTTNVNPNVLEELLVKYI